MKVLVVVNNYPPHENEEKQSWFVLADSAITNTGKPFYLPENLGKVTASIAPAIKISRLGKGIAQKFASRYYSEYAPAVIFQLPDFEKNLRANGLPADAARNFDRALFIGDFSEISSAMPLSFSLNGEKMVGFNFSEMHLSTDQIINNISLLNTLKIGDIIVPAFCGNLEIKEGDFLEVNCGERKAFSIKVK